MPDNWDKSKEELIKELHELKQKHNFLKESYAKDVADHKQTEATLRYCQERLEEAQKTAKIGNWEANLITGELYWSDEIFDIFGFDCKTFNPSVTAFYNSVHPDDKQ